MKLQKWQVTTGNWLACPQQWHHNGTTQLHPPHFSLQYFQTLCLTAILQRARHHFALQISTFYIVKIHISMSNYDCRVWKCHVRTVLQFSHLNLPTNLNSENGWGWKGSLEVILSRPPTHAGPRRAVFPGHVHRAFEYFWGRKFHNLSRWPATVLSQAHSKKLFPDVQRAPPVFSLCSLPLSLGTTQRRLSSPSLHLPFKYLYSALIRSQIHILQIF